MKKVISLFLLVHLFLLMTMAETYRYDVRPILIMNRDFVDTIPLVVRNNRVYVEVTVGSHRSLFLLDTGSGLGMVSAGSDLEPIRELGTLPTSIDFNGMQRSERIVELPEMQIGKVRVKHYPIVHSRQQAAWDNALGFALINKGLMAKIDVRNKQLILTDRKKFFDREKGFAVKYKLQQSVPYVALEPFEGVREWTLLDTGNPGLFFLSHSQLKEWFRTGKPIQEQVEWQTEGVTQRGVHGVDEAQPVAFLHLNRIRWGDYCLEDVRTLTKPGDSNVGAALLKYGALIINPFSKRVVFQPYSDEDYTVIGNRHREVILVEAPDGRAQIGLIWRDSEAYKQGVRQGDILQKINGQEIGTYEAYRRYLFLRGQTYVYTLYNPRRHFTYEIKMGSLRQE